MKKVFKVLKSVGLGLAGGVMPVKGIVTGVVNEVTKEFIDNKDASHLTKNGQIDWVRIVSMALSMGGVITITILFSMGKIDKDMFDMLFKYLK